MSSLSSNPMVSPSLDDLLQEIERDSIAVPPLNSAGVVGSAAPMAPSVGMQDISAHLTIDTGGPIAAAMPGGAGGVGEVGASGAAGTAGQDLWETNLTERQRSLPKLSLSMLGGIAAVFVLMLGLGSVTFLSQQNQDLRQQAYVDTLPELAGESAILTEQELQAEQRLLADGDARETGVDGITQQVQSVIGQTPSPVADLFLGGLVVGGIGLIVIALFAWLFL